MMVIGNRHRQLEIILRHAVVVLSQGYPSSEPEGNGNHQRQRS